MAQQPYQVINLFDWTGGVRDRRHNSLAFPLNALTAGENVDLADGGLKTRLGMSVAHPNTSNPTGTIRSLKQVRFPTTETTYVIAQASGRNEIVWEPTIDGPERANHSLCYDAENDRDILFGGSDTASQYNNDVWARDRATGEWTELTCTGGPPIPRYGHTAHINPANGSMYVLYGRAEGGALNDVWKLDLDTLVWSQIAASGTKPSARYHHASALIGTTAIMLCGGHYGAGLGTTISFTRYYDLNLGTGAWTEIEGTTEGYSDSRSGHSLTFDGNNICIVAGGNVNDEFYTNTAYSLNRATHAWTQIANLPDIVTTGLAYHCALYCRGYVVLVAGGGAVISDTNTTYLYYDLVRGGSWGYVAAEGSIGARRSAAMATDDSGNVIIHGGETCDPTSTVLPTTFLSSRLCSAAAGMGFVQLDGLFASNTHLPSNAMVFEAITTLAPESGVCEFAVLGDRLIITEGVTDPPLVMLPGVLSTDPVESWASPMRVLLTYDGQNYHDVSDRVLDNDLDSVGDIGGITTRGAILLCCDVPTVHGFYLQFKTPNTATGATSEFSDETKLNATAKVNRENIGQGIARWVQDSGGATGHFVGPTRALSGAAVDLGGSPNRVKIPCIGHGLVAGNHASIRNTAGYDNDYLLPDQTGGDADHFIIEHAHIAETFGDPSEVRQWFTVGKPGGWTANLPLIGAGAAVEFSDATLSVRGIVEGGHDYDTVTLSAAHETDSVLGIYGITINDADVVTVAASTDVPDTLATFVPDGKLATSRVSIRQVIKGSDLSRNSAFLRVKLQSGFSGTLVTYTGGSQGYNSTPATGLHIVSAGIVERSGNTANGVTTPTQLTFANGNSDVDIPPSYPPWRTGLLWRKGFKSTVANVVYECQEIHYGGDWAADLAAGKWVATDDALGFVWSDFVQFTVDNQKDYLVILDCEA